MSHQVERLLQRAGDFQQQAPRFGLIPSLPGLGVWDRERLGQLDRSAFGLERRAVIWASASTEVALAIATRSL